MLRFTIKDYTTDPNGVSTQIDEPIGWDGINLRLKRDKNWHGFFDFADDTTASLQFHGDGFTILKTAYETYGSQANVQLLIEYQCATGDEYDQLYLGRFVFSTYKDICGDECYSEIGIEALSCLMIFRNRYDQQVDLDSLESFDGDVLPEYDGLNKQLTLPSKVIFLQSLAVSTESKTTYAIQNPDSTAYPTGYLPDGGGGYLTGTRTAWFSIPSNVTQSDLSTINGTITEYAPNGINTNSYPSALFKLDLLPICPAFQIRIQISFTGTFTNSGSANRSEELKFIIVLGETAWTGSGAIIIDTTSLYSYTGTSPDTQNFNYSIDETITVAAGQSLFLYFFYECFKSDNAQNDPTVTVNNDFSIDLSSESQCDATRAGVYLINETLSRCVEAVTNDCMRVYSDYFGRTDAEPYPSDADGCGALRAVINGLRIRNAPNSDGNTPQKMTVSMQDMFDALNSTDNIGIGLEDDPFRPYENAKLIRVEPQEYFYNQSILMTCDSIRKVERNVDSSLIFSTIRLGYQKWKTWNINGLNDIFTPREYRTELAELKNELDKTCKFLASDYAIEWTRRQYGLTTADSRYDNDIFFLCLTRDPYEYNVRGNFIAFIGTIVIQGVGYQFQIGDTIDITGTASNDGTYTITFIEEQFALNTTSIVVAEALTDENGIGFTITSNNIPYTVEQGLVSPTNILNPDTVMNYRLAPTRNTMRWLKSLLQSYRQYLTGTVIFTSGEGNILASGEVLTPCRLENAVIAENQNLSLDNFATPEDNYPLFYPELVKFEYPMTYEQYLTVLDNPYGLIGYQCGSGAIEYGWIEDMQYSPYNGLVNFTLRPKIEI